MEALFPWVIILLINLAMPKDKGQSKRERFADERSKFFNMFLVAENYVIPLRMIFCVLSSQVPFLPKGASIYDVRTDGGRGVSPKEDVVREVA